METSFTKRYMFKSLMIIALILGITFFYLNHIDFISSALEYGKMNMSNIAYAVLQIIGGLVIPAVFIIPSMFSFGRIRLARISFIAYGICHLLTILWMINFFMGNRFLDIFSVTKLSDFFVNNGYVYQLTIWDTYTLASLLFSIIYGVAAIYTGLYFDKDRNIAKWFVAALLLLRLILPFINNIIFQGRLYSLFWISNNYLLLAAQLCFTLAIFIAGSEDPTWIEFVWDQMVFTESEYDEITDDLNKK